MAEQTILIGQRIREAREDAHLTQDQLAAQLPGKSNGTQVSKWERGVHRPGDDTLEHIADALGHDVAWFILPERSVPDAPTPELSDALEPAWVGRLERTLKEVSGRLDGLERELRTVASRDSELSQHDRELLGRFEEMIQRLGRDIGRGQPRSRGAKPNQAAAAEPSR